MAKKDFTAMLNSSTEKKIDVNLKLENQRLKDTIKELQNHQSTEYNNISMLKISEINLGSNIRDNYEFEEIQELANDISDNGQLQPVLLTKDNYLIAGYRRYHALKHLSEESEILVSRLDKENNEIDQIELKKIQFAENYQRRNIDNFQLSNLFNWYIEQGYSQKDIAEKFKKSKGVISVVIGIKDLDKKLVDYIKQFQIYGVSYKKFVATNSEEQQTFLDKKEIIGYRPIYNIAKLPLEEQKKAFLKNYSNRLSEQELNSDFFKNENKVIEKDKEHNTYHRAFKSINSLKDLVEKFNKNISINESEDFKNAATYLLKLEKIFTENFEKIK